MHLLLSCSNMHLCTLLQVVGWVGVVVDNAQGPQQQRCSPGSFITYWYRTTPSLMPHWWHGAKTNLSLFPSISLLLSPSLHMYMYIYLYVYVYIYIYMRGWEQQRDKTPFRRKELQLFKDRPFVFHLTFFLTEKEIEQLNG